MWVDHSSSDINLFLEGVAVTSGNFCVFKVNYLVKDPFNTFQTSLFYKASTVHSISWCGGPRPPGASSPPSSSSLPSSSSFAASRITWATMQGTIFFNFRQSYILQHLGHALEKYVLLFWQRHLSIWTNTFCHLDKYVSNLEKHIWQIGQKHFAISTNTFCNEHLVADTCATSCWWSASASSSLPSPSLPSWSTPSSVGQLPPSGFSSQCFHLICTWIKSKVDNIKVKIKTLFLICCISPGMFIVQFQKCLHQ